MNLADALLSAGRRVSRHLPAPPRLLARRVARRLLIGGIDRRDVVWGYRLFLDREPESEAAIRSKLRAWQTTSELRRDFLTSDEFRANAPDLAADREQLVVIGFPRPGLRLFVDLADSVTGWPLARGTYEPVETAFLERTVRPGDIVLDIGAHIGAHTVLCAQLSGPAGRVHAIEASASNVDMLRRSVTENGFEDRVTVHHMAATASAGRLRLVRGRASTNTGGAHLLPDSAPLPDGFEETWVTAGRIDDLDLPRPLRIVKIDVEGAEPMALAGAHGLLVEDRPIILSEVYGDGLARVSGVSPRDYIAQVEGYGYVARLLEMDGPGARIRDCRPEDVLSVVFLPATS